MNDGLKQRIVGAVVLLALAIIFMPVLFDFDDKRVMDTRSRIPPKPEIAPVQIPEPTRVENVQAPKAEEQLYQFDSSREAAEKATDNTPKDEPPSLSREGLPVSWVIQVGSFRERAAADKLSSQLIADGYKAFVRDGTAENTRVHRVYVDPKIEKSRALQTKKTIDKKYGVSSLVLEFEP